MSIRRALTLALATLLPLPAAMAATVQYLGQQIVPSGTPFNGTTVGGLSGIDRDPATGRYLAISDDRSSLQPARFYELSLDLAQFVRSANPGQAGVSFNSVTTILRPDGAAFATNTVDPESLRLNPTTGLLMWSNEGQRGGAGVPALQSPTVREMNRDGSWTRDFSVPTRYAPAGTGATDAGIRNNLAFESLSFSVDGRTLYTAVENALVQDGPAATLANGSLSRILSFDVASGAAGAEFVYEVGPVVLPPAVSGGFATNGLVELLAVGACNFIAIERSFAAGAATPGVGPNGLPTGNSIRLYEVDACGATDVSGVDSLAGASYTAASKTLLADLSDFRHDDNTPLAVDNIEGITWGPLLNGRQTLILVSDNNFSGTQFTQFVALALDNQPLPLPGSLALVPVALAAGALVRRRRR